MSEEDIEIIECTAAPLSVLGESPVWLPGNQAILYIDISGKRLHLYRDDPVSDSTAESMAFDEAIGFAVPLSSPNGSLIVAVGLEASIVKVDFTAKRVLSTLALVEDRPTENGRFNDGKCAPDGSIIGGYMHTKWRDGNKGELYILNRQGKLDKLLPSGEIHLPNGYAWVGDILYFVDSGSAVVYRFVYTREENVNAVDGGRQASLTDKSVVFSLPSEMVSQGLMMDGMTVDQEGMLWIAIPGGGCIIRIDPIKGEEIYRLALPVKKPTSLCFGGNSLEYMYVTTRNEGSEVDPMGKLLRCRVPWAKGMLRSEVGVVYSDGEQERVEVQQDQGEETRVAEEAGPSSKRADGTADDTVEPSKKARIDKEESSA